MGESTITSILQEIRAGDPGALDRLVPLVYDDLRRMAAAYLARERETPSIQPTAVVHELYFKLVDQQKLDWNDRHHFLATAAILMRRLLVDLARRRAAEKRGGNDVVRLDTGADVAAGRATDVVKVHEALEELAALDPRQARVVELRFFGGLTIEETAEVLGISAATAKRDWAMARAFLQAELAS